MKRFYKKSGEPRDSFLSPGRWTIFLLFLILFLLPAKLLAGGGEDLSVYWKNGLGLKNKDGSFKFKIGGRIMNDWVYSKGDEELEAIGEVGDGTEFRRVRFYNKGSLADLVFYKLQFDFAGGNAVLKDAYVGFENIPGLKYVFREIKAGHYKETFSLEELTSSKYITFLERALPNAFAVSRNTGITLYGDQFDQRLTYAAGVFWDADKFGKSEGGGDYHVTARITALPLYLDKGKKLLHLGVASSYGAAAGGTLHYNARPEVHLAPKFLDLEFDADTFNLIGAELAVVFGSFSLQGEYILNMVQTEEATGGSASFSGYYVLASCWLTGEHRYYKKSTGAFTRVKKLKNKFGGFELAARYSYIDLNDSDIYGGELSNITAGLNYHINPNTRVMLNYVLSDPKNIPTESGIDESAGKAHFFTTRFQVDF